MSPAYTLSLSAELRRALNAFPNEVRSEIESRIENTLALPVSDKAVVQTSTIDVEGHKATLKLDSAARVVEVVDVFSPARGWAIRKTA